MTPTLPSPKHVREEFKRLAHINPEDAARYLYSLGVEHGYIKLEAIARNMRWTTQSDFGELECTINFSKPEKDPRDIAAAILKSEVQPKESSVPQCDLCWENEDFPGTAARPAKPGLRIAEITLGDERWGLQYSPYAYYKEHCIALSEQHRPMKINRACFEKLLDFVDLFPFYFIGSNADLPVVGGSILSHDHFQGGRHEFPLMKAPLSYEFAINGLSEVKCGIARWPASVIRLESKNRKQLIHAASLILSTWKAFDFEGCNIRAYSKSPSGEQVSHNTLNPIVVKTNDIYIMYLVLRNNRTDEQHPWGIFHPGEHLHHIKKENIGLIEIMGLAIFPPRITQSYPLVDGELSDCAKREIGQAFEEILHATAVFKHDNAGKEGWLTFIGNLNRQAPSKRISR